MHQERYTSNNPNGHKPVKLLQSAEIELSVARFPQGFDINSLSPPFVVESETNDDENPNTHAESLLSKWLLSDAKKKKLRAEKAPLDTSTYFVMVERNDCVELLPINSWYNFRSQFKVESSIQTVTAEVAERKRRTALLNEETRNAYILNKMNPKKTTQSNDIQHTKNRISDVYAEDAGLLSQHKRKLRHALKEKKQRFLKEDEGVQNSALNLGELKRAEVDWDWDDDGKATDDEEEDTEQFDLGHSEDFRKNEYLEPDGEDDGEELLSKFGQRINSALETQKEQEEIDELAQFSDDEEQPVQSIATSQPPAVEEARSALATHKARDELKTKKLKSKHNEEDGKSPESLKQKVIRVLSLHGGRMSTREFVEQFNITDKQSEQFQAMRKILNEICEVFSEMKNGVSVRVIELQSQFRS